MKVVLAYLCEYRDRKDYYLSLLPVGLLSMAAYLEKKGHKVVLANLSKQGSKRGAALIKKEKGNLLGVSIFTHNREESRKLIQLVKKGNPSIVIVAGGPHAAHLSDEYVRRYPEIDHIITGEGEKAFAALLKDLSKGKSSPGIIKGGRIDDLECLPVAASFRGKMIGVHREEQFKYIVTSRGCPHKCTYCCSPSFWGRKVTMRSAEDVAGEIEYIYRTMGIIYFSIRDDNFTINKKRVMEFCRILMERKIYAMWNCQSRVDSIDLEMITAMKQAGLEHIQFGVESGSPEILKKYDKSISIDEIKNAAAAARKAGVYLSIYLMSGMEGEGRRDVRKTVSLIRKILPGDGIVSPVALYPGTALYEEALKKGNIDPEIWFRSGEPGIFMRRDREAQQWMEELLIELGTVRERSWYVDRDFAGHRETVGRDCWVTDILEGDYYLDEEVYDTARDCYLRVVEKYPGNIWGFYRMGKLFFMAEDFEGALEYYKGASKLLPQFFGSWLKLAEVSVALGEKGAAKKYVRRAEALNPRDVRVKNIRRITG